ncbi:MAG: aminodeoxychorismate synthase, component I [Gammaproteobacteria bacterium RIFCSPHIGHO2_12_FULL_40_19]|nr:MAG: aminodeoxychorismate synthase, component I [Gammaproteobacteria bacterium RIFCSPHIGHO2_12_FULL_40_19]
MYTQQLPYTENTAELFEHFVQLPYAIFFDSCFFLQKQGRYDIITADPSIVISKSNDTFADVQCALMDLKNKADCDNPYHLPFTIGAMGYLSYDIGRQLENIPALAIDDIAIPQAVVGIYDWSIVVDHIDKKIFFTSLYAFDHPKIKNIFKLLNQTPVVKKDFSVTKNFQSNMTKSFYDAAFQKIKENINDGNCYQVNLAQRFSAEFTGSPWHAYQLLREKNPAPYAVFMQLNNAAILSMSPERFLKVTDRVVETKPIKGTSKRFADPILDQASADELCRSEKDRAENVMIVDLLRNDLSGACIAGSVKTPKLCALESFSNVHHLVSRVTGKLAPHQTSLNLLQRCFPGGSITGAPKIAAMKIIESLEPHRRSLYCGSLFYIDIHDNCDSNIAIRTVICDDNKMHCYAGGGIVYDSESDKEYAETWAKVGRMIGILSG